MAPRPGHGGGSLLDSVHIGHLVEHGALGERQLNIAEAALHVLILAVVILHEHPDDARQHQNARHSEDNVQRLLIAVSLISSCHGFLKKGVRTLL